MEMHYECKSLFPIHRLIPLIILLEGFVSIAVEILTIRQLLPVAGGSVVVTSLIIGIFLLFLALGYRHGGRVSQHLQKKLRTNFIITSLWLGIGLSYCFILYFFNFIQKIVGTHIVYSLLAYLLLIIAPLIFILGQTIPITMNMIKQNRTAGLIGGDTLGLSTLGSFLGATITAMVLMHYFGVAWTVFINFMLLTFLILLLSENFILLILQTCFAVGALWIVYDLNVDIENKNFLLANNYANYQILDDRNSELKQGEKILSINNSLSSFIDTHEKGFKYIEAIKQILFKDLQLHNADILVLGAGGFTLSAENTYGNRFTYVDIDNQLTKVVVPHFLNHLNNTLIADDARHYLRNTKKQYAVIIADAYSNIKSIPAHLLTREYMLEIQQKLLQDGLAIFNIIAKPSLSDPYSKRIDNTIRTVFHNCTVMPLTYADTVTNILYVCHNSKNQEDHVIYSDNLNTSTTDSFDW